MLIGMEVEVTGVLEPGERVVRAERVRVLTHLTGPVEGIALVEGREDIPAGSVLSADGRKLLITDSTRFTVPDGNMPSLDRSDLLPGVFIHYQGRGARAGLVEVDQVAAWPNRLEEKEKEIYQKYEPHILLPEAANSGPPVLKVAKNRYQVLDDKELQLYVDRIGNRLLPELWREAAQGLGARFWFIVVVHERAQASAFPSGVVVAGTGLFRLAENEAQMAFAIAHEIAHVTQEHAWQEHRYQRGKLLFLRWSTAGIGYLVESAIRRGYRRSLEEQADRLALAYMARAGYDPPMALRRICVYCGSSEGERGTYKEAAAALAEALAA
ncbi:MAG: M48 family metalloprotease, partial [Acidobacteria bacterium]|nr:M48 family metalloprotease [Acidobacteriota bacterium]